jgi:hypothetical protein
VRNIDLPDNEEIHRLFEYQDGQLLYKKGRKGKMIAGRCSTLGRMVVTINRIHYDLSRVIFKLFNPEFDGTMIIHHVDNDNLNNRIENLKAIYLSERFQLVDIRRNNRSGVKGISLDSNGKWRCTKRVGGKRVFIGRFHSISAAKRAIDNYQYKDD